MNPLLKTHTQQQPAPMNFKETRTALGYSQSQIAPLIGVSVKAVQSYEQNLRNPSKSVLMLLERLKPHKP